ncbi:efflux RND transporter permease subunit [Shumkonia mesophila]|uniref:efflux RND transporter permease subunit n=1 Tax=Shumkonia mesophila TaxID=2838854 RepID=UPI002934CA27|nr:efflux RND transporter permease subunit [Shumkonia mesophila]
MSGNSAAGGESGPGKLFRFFFIDTIFAGVLGVLLLLGGLFAYTSMVKEGAPDLAIPVAQVRVLWPGASPELVEKEVTTPLEKAIKSLNNLKQISSGSRSGLALLVVEFQADAPIEESIRSLRTKVTETASLLPRDSGAPTVEQMSTTDAPILTYMIHGNVGDAVLGDTARDIKERLERIGSLRKVEVSGARQEIGRVLIDPMRLNAVNLSMTMVSDAIRAGSVDRPLGEMRDGRTPASINLAGRFTTVDEIRLLPIQQMKSGRIVRLGDLAEVRRELSTESVRTFVSFAGKPFAKGVSISLYKAPGADTVAAVAQVRRTVESFQMPKGVEASVLTNEAVDVEEKLASVFSNAVQAVIGVVLILLVMLTWREAVIAGAGVPITFLGSIAVVFAFGMTMNEMVVIGMVLALGMLVDVFILVMEGMHQGLYAEGRSFDSAAGVTVKRFALPAFAGQLTTILALTPLLFLPGIDGKFIRLIPFTAIICLVISYIVAFVWALPSSRHLLGRKLKGDGVTRVDRITNRVSGRLLTWVLAYVVSSRRAAALWMTGVLVLVVASLAAGGLLPSEAYPKVDGRNMGITVELPPGTPLDRTAEVGLKVGDILRAKPYFQSTIAYVGQKSPFSVTSSAERIADTPGTHVVGFSLVLTPLDARDGRLAYTYVPELRRELYQALAEVPGASVTLSPQGGGPGGGDDLQIDVQGEDLDQLRNAAQEVVAALATVRGTGDVRDDMGPARTALVVTPVREALEFFKIRLTPVAEEIGLAMGETTVAKLKRSATEDDVPVQLGVAWPSRNGEAGPPTSWNDLMLVRASGPDGTRIDLASILIAEYGSLPQVIVHSDGNRTTSVRGKAEGSGTAAILRAAWPEIEKVKARYPNLRIGLAGQLAEANQTNSNMMKMFLLTMVLMFGLLVLLFNSYRLPFIILFSVPCALIGTLVGFLAIGMPLSFPAMVGIVSLLGIVVNVSIVMVETMREFIELGRSVGEAAAHGAADRLRPILSTTLTTIAGLALLSLSSPMWQPLCYAIIFGLMAATVLSFIVVPALFVLLSPRAALR